MFKVNKLENKILNVEKIGMMYKIIYLTQRKTYKIRNFLIHILQQCGTHKWNIVLLGVNIQMPYILNLITQKNKI